MTEEYFRKLVEANKKACNESRAKLLRDLERSEHYAFLISQTAVSFFEKYDHNTELFDTEAIMSELPEEFGKPKSITTPFDSNGISFDLNYRDNLTGELDLPLFIANGDINFSLVNDMLLNNNCLTTYYKDGTLRINVGKPILDMLNSYISDYKEEEKALKRTFSIYY